MPEMLMTTEALMEIESLADTTVLVTDVLLRGPEAPASATYSSRRGRSHCPGPRRDLIEIDIPIAD